MFIHQDFKLPNLIEAGFLSVIKQKNLINENNINQLFHDQKTALHIAIISNQVQIAEFLLKLNPDLTLKDSLELRAFDYLGFKQNKGAFELVTKYFPQQKYQTDLLTPINEANLNIWRASQLGLEQLEPFFSRSKENKPKERNPFVKDKQGRKAIHWAAISGTTQTFNFLIQHKFDPLQEDNFGFNSYHYIMVNPCNPLSDILNKSQSNLDIQIRQNHYDVIVIGSGAAGIGAGVTLSRNGLKYVVLEARERIGGRILSTKVSEIELDMGACWVHSYSKANPICKQANQLKWKARKSQNRTDAVYVSQLKPNLSQKQINSAHMLSQTYFSITEQEALNSQKDMSLEEAGKEYYENHIATLAPERKALVDMFINMTEHYHASSAKQLSAKYFEQQVDAGGDFTPEGSYHKLITAIADSVGFLNNTKFSSVVDQIVYSKDKDYCEVRTKDGTVYYGKKIISSLPLGILKAQKVQFIPELPEQHLQCIQKLGYGTMNKIIVSFEQPFWKQNPSWIRIACQQKGKFPAIYNFSTQDKHILCCFVTDNFAQSISALTDQQIIQSFLEVLKRSFKNQQIKVIDYSITRWDQDEFSLGSYTHFDVDSSMETCKRLRQNIQEKLWMVGQHCYAEHIGCAHGAFQTGIWAAEQILDCFKHVDLAFQII